jgi:hypothetical protein
MRVPNLLTMTLPYGFVRHPTGLDRLLACHSLGYRPNLSRVRRGHWQQIEAGRSITVTTLLRICDTFRVPMARLVRGRDKGLYGN